MCSSARSEAEQAQWKEEVAHARVVLSYTEFADTELTDEQARAFLYEPIRWRNVVTSYNLSHDEGDQEMSTTHSGFIICPKCQGTYNPTLCLEECPHRPKHNVTADGGPCPATATATDQEVKDRIETIRAPAKGDCVYLYQKTALPGGKDDYYAEATAIELMKCQGGQPDQYIVMVQGSGMLPGRWLFTHIQYSNPGAFGWSWDTPTSDGKDEPQEIEWMGLRTHPTRDELDNRFSYHPPKEGQGACYQTIRGEARRFAQVLRRMCPPSPEFASALDHLDTVVFKANASIARHK